MIIRPFAESDLAGVLFVAAQSFAEKGWDGEDYLRLPRQPGGLILVAEQAPGLPVAGFAALRQTLDEAELLNFAVDPAHRRQGIGKALLAESIRQVRQAGAKSVFLEVRPSNEIALGLYYFAGFTLHSIRKSYYSQPAEDALVLTLRLDPLEEP